MKSEENESEELTLAYISIETMKQSISALESENKKLQEMILKIKNDTNLSSSCQSEEGYHRGFGGHGY